MTYRIQKTIISKYLDLVDKSSTTEAEINELLDTIKNLYVNRTLTKSDIFRQKIELIETRLNYDLTRVTRKRKSKEIRLEITKDLYDILKSDLEGIDYSKTALVDLEKIENEKEISISLGNVVTVLENLVVLKRSLNAEVNFEKFTVEQLAYVFGKDKIARQYSIGGFLALKTDIDVGNGQVGIELKIADHLSATGMQRLIGQVLYYKKRFYNSNLLIFMASRYSISSHIKELIDFVEELGVKVIYCQAVKG